MCYDISFTVEIKQIPDYFPDLVFDGQIEINFDGTHILGHAFQEHPIIYTNKEDNELHIRMMEWGCVPFYVKELEKFKKQRAKRLNARAERILDDPESYWYKIRNNRCLIPLNGFYEHSKVTGFKNKIPYFLTLKKQRTFFLPALYSTAEIVDIHTGELVKLWSFPLITTVANSLMKQIHNDGENKWRMPLLLPFELSQKWVQKDLSEDEYRAILNYQMPSEELNYLPVFSIRTSKLRPDHKAKNEYYDWGNLSKLKIA